MACQVKTGLFALEACGAAPTARCNGCGCAFCAQHGRRGKRSLCVTCFLAEAPVERSGEEPGGWTALRPGAAAGAVVAGLVDDEFTEEDLLAMDRAQGTPDEERDASRFES